MATITADIGGGNWSATSTWIGGVVPTATSDVLLTATSGNVTIDATAVGRSLNCTGYTGTLSHATGVTLTLGDATAGASNVALLFVSGMTYSLSGTNTITLASTSATQQTITTGGKTFNNLTLNGTGSSYQLQDNLATTSNFTVSKGIFDANNKNLTLGSFVSSNSNARTITMGSGTWTLTGTVTVWTTATATNLTLTPGTSTIVLSDTTSAAKFFAGGGKTFNNLTITGGGTGAVQLQGSNTFNVVTVNPPKTFQLVAGTTQTIASLVVTGTFGNIITINSGTAGSAGTISQASGTVAGDYLSVKDSTATGGATFNAAHSTNVSGNTGWNFLVANVPSRTMMGVGA